MKTTGLKNWEVLQLAEGNPDMKCRPCDTRANDFDSTREWSFGDPSILWEIETPPEQKVTVTKAQLAEAWDKHVPIINSSISTGFKDFCKALGFTSDEGEL
jgi:hypothetical protein